MHDRPIVVITADPMARVVFVGTALPPVIRKATDACKRRAVSPERHVVLLREGSHRVVWGPISAPFPPAVANGQLLSARAAAIE